MNSEDMKKGGRLKISICTVCMNRLHHLKQTLPQNIDNNISYGNIEFVVLGYSSKDGLAQWIKTEMRQFLNMGILVFYETNEPKYFHMSHSKNLAARCATGEIICNVDADNFIGKGFASWINRLFQQPERIFISPNPNSSSRDCLGRICVRTKDFLLCTGYDENMVRYGFEDRDLKQRLRLLGLKNVFIENQKFLNAITHEDQERLENDGSLNQFDKILIKFIDYKSSYLLFLLKNNSYCLGIVLDNRLQNSLYAENLLSKNRIHQYKYSLENDKWEEGEWKFLGKDIILDNAKILNGINPKNITGQEFKQRIFVNGNIFDCVFDEDAVLALNMFFSQITNRNLMKKNSEKKLIRVNRDRFGSANLIKNFDSKVSFK